MGKARNVVYFYILFEAQFVYTIAVYLFILILFTQDHYLDHYLKFQEHSKLGTTIQSLVLQYSIQLRIQYNTVYNCVYNTIQYTTTFLGQGIVRNRQ